MPTNTTPTAQRPDRVCDRCRQPIQAGRMHVVWPEGRICDQCFEGTRPTTTSCLRCGISITVPKSTAAQSNSVCAQCGTEQVSDCADCREWADRYRSGRCTRCRLAIALQQLLGVGRSDPAPTLKLANVLAASDRPESVLIWMRSDHVHHLLTRIGTSELPLTHAGLDAEPPGRHVEHLRSILEHHGLLEPRDHYLSLFERWLSNKLTPIQDTAIRQPVEHFARWHHVNRIRAMHNEGTSRSRGPVHSAKQEITETLKFLNWLNLTYGKQLSACTQQDVDEYLADGPTTRQLIRTFFVWADRAHVKDGIVIGHRPARTTPAMTQDDRLASIRSLLTGDEQNRPYRVAGVLLLLYAQPLVRVTALKVDAVVSTSSGLGISFGSDPAPLPEPFANLVRQHLSHRPNQRVANADSDWFFPGTRAGKHLHPITVMIRLRNLGIDLLGARNTALRQLVTTAPPPVVATMLGYSAQVAHLHAAAAAAPFGLYATSAPTKAKGTVRISVFLSC